MLLRADSVGFSVTDTVLLYEVFSVSCVIAVPLIGWLNDNVGRPHMIMLGYGNYAVMCLGFAFTRAKWQVLVWFVLHGILYAIDEAQNKAFIADLEAERHASAVGLYNPVTGLVYLPASLLAAALLRRRCWHRACLRCCGQIVIGDDAWAIKKRPKTLFMRQ